MVLLVFQTEMEHMFVNVKFIIFKNYIIHFNYIALFKSYDNLAYIGCFHSNWQHWDLFTFGLSQSSIQSSEWNTNTWQPINGISNWYAWKSSMTVAQCENYCKTKGFLLAGLANG